ncbi:MAG: type II and III secretion system protein [Ignavibacteriales bacterium]|nr:type II and III secretion system protein [Ignavibacteriales bacterium]
MKKNYIFLFALCLLFVQASFGQARDARLKTKGYVNPQEIVSLDSTMRMDQALLVINELSKQFAGKIIIDLEKRKGPIGVYVVNQHWRDALDMILSRNGMMYVEEADYIRIMQAGAAPQVERGAGGAIPGEPPPTLDSRDVKISAVFFSTDITKMQEFGISWHFFRNKGKEPLEEFYLSSGLGLGDSTGHVPAMSRKSKSQMNIPPLSTGIGVLESPPEFKFANIDALIKFFGTNQLGEVLTSPDIIVRNGKPGRIQVGKDIFITSRDIAGNTINQLISTGTIIEVTPAIYTQSDTDFVYLNMTIEQSESAPGATGPEISRNQVKTHTLLYDGEETVIGGLIRTQEVNSREGIPFLKDLPWWFLGLRYLFGSDVKYNSKAELIILLKVELLQPIRERMLNRTTRQEIINNKRKANARDFEKNP